MSIVKDFSKRKELVIAGKKIASIQPQNVLTDLDIQFIKKAKESELKQWLLTRKAKRESLDSEVKKLGFADSTYEVGEVVKTHDGFAQVMDKEFAGVDGSTNQSWIYYVRYTNGKPSKWLSEREMAQYVAEPEQRNAMLNVFESAEDLKWLSEVHGIPIDGVAIAIVHGNESSPTKVETFECNDYRCKPIVYQYNSDTDRLEKIQNG